MVVGYYILGVLMKMQKTPAFKYNDGQDFTPASKFTVFSHQFSSITGAGPVTGPIIAAMYGWLPAFFMDYRRWHFLWSSTGFLQHYMLL